MATIRQANWLGGQRVDVQHLRMIDLATAGDFDLLAGQIIAGNLGLIVSGFEVLGSSISGAASSVQLVVDGALLIHPQASESGSLFMVESGQANDTLNSSNSRVVGSFIAGTVNYVGIDLVRSEDESTSDITQFHNPDTGKEVAEDVPLARTLDYRIYITTNDFSLTPGILPIAKIETDSSNNVVSITDCRWMLGRLGSGGSTADAQNAYSWPGGRSEAGDNSSFTEGDRKIGDLKSILDSLRSRIWEIGGGEYWYSPTADRNVKMVRTGSPFATTGDWFEWVSSNLHWKGLKVLFDNSTGYVNEIADQTTDSAGLTDLADGECLYVDIDRTQNLTGGSALVAQKAVLVSLGVPTVPGSRWILAWRYGSSIYTRESTFNVGMVSPVATTLAVGTVKLAYTAGAPSAPVVLPQNANGQIVVDAAVSNAVTSLSATGFIGIGVNGGNAMDATGGSSTTGAGGRAVTATGGAGGNGGGTAVQATGGTSSGAIQGGNGIVSAGGNSTASSGGNGITSTGGTTVNNGGGAGGLFFGGTASGTGGPGNGITGTGGAASGSNASPGGNGATLTGGSSSNAQDGGIGAVITGGTNSGSGAAGKGATITAGTRSNSGDGSSALVVTGGAANTSGLGGDGLVVTAGAGVGASSRGGTAIKATAGDNGGQIALLTKAATDNRSAISLDSTGVTIAKNTNTNGDKNISPSLRFLAKNTDEPNHFTHLGFPTSQVCKFLEDWSYTNTTAVTTQRWSFTNSTGGGQVGLHTINNPDSNYAASYMKFTATSGSGSETNSCLVNTGRPIFPNPNAFNSHLYLQAEWSGVGATALDANAEYWIGFSDTPGTPNGGSANTAVFRWLGGTDTGAVWYSFTSNAGTGTATSLGVAPGGSAPQQVLKIEFYGSLTEAGSTTVVFSVDGIVKQTSTTNLPVTSMYMFFLVKAKTAALATRAMAVGNTEVYWNPLTASTMKR